MAPSPQQAVSRGSFLFIALLWGAVHAAAGQGATIEQTSGSVRVRAESYGIDLELAGFRYTLRDARGEVIAPAHATSGLHFHGGDAQQTTLEAIDGDRVRLRVVNDAGGVAHVEIQPSPTFARFSVSVESSAGEDRSIVLRTGGVGPAFGLADHAGWRPGTELTGYRNDQFRAGSGSGVPHSRMVSNFVIFPRQRLAEVNVEPRTKIVRLTKDENAQGATDADDMPAMYYLFGDIERIYADFLTIRNEHGYPVLKPKYEWFGVGWEAFGALGWNTNEKTVAQNVQRYLDLGYPLRWMVVGSGFWPPAKNTQATTSFGMWDPAKYPDPRRFVEHFHDRGLKLFIGLRIAFICDGPFAAEGVEKGYFVRENGQARQFQFGFPKSPAYMLDTQNPDAVQWYVALCQRWLDVGIDGFKEDLFGFRAYDLRDDKIDPVNTELMRRGVYVMGRNGYLAPPGDIQRFEDFNYNQRQDRGPINGLSLAYAAMPNVYPDIVGGTGLTTNQFGEIQPEQLKTYLMRSAQYASVNPAMSFGYGPWNLRDPQVEAVCLQAARLHAALHPYIYSSAVDAWKTGFPHTLCPLPLRWPDQPQVYELDESVNRRYQWMLGESLLATPLYGDDYMTAASRDVFLPPGRWMDYDTGETYDGPVTLDDFPLPPGKTPLFVGGKGIIALQEQPDAIVQAVVFPVTHDAAQWTFHWPEGEPSVIRVEAPTDSRAAVTVIDAATRQPVPFTVRQPTGSTAFPMESGRTYLVQWR